MRVCLCVCGWACVCASSVSGSFVRGEEWHRCVYVSATRTTRSARLAVVVPFPSGLLACVGACCLLCKEGEGGKSLSSISVGGVGAHRHRGCRAAPHAHLRSAVQAALSRTSVLLGVLDHRGQVFGSSTSAVVAVHGWRVPVRRLNQQHSAHRYVVAPPLPPVPPPDNSSTVCSS